MPVNSGKMPRYEFVDIKFRNGVVRRHVEPKHWNWKPLPCSPHDFDITEYQACK